MGGLLSEEERRGREEGRKWMRKLVGDGGGRDRWEGREGGISGIEGGRELGRERGSGGGHVGWGLL